MNEMQRFPAGPDNGPPRSDAFHERKRAMRSELQQRLVTSERRRRRRRRCVAGGSAAVVAAITLLPAIWSDSPTGGPAGVPTGESIGEQAGVAVGSSSGDSIGDLTGDSTGDSTGGAAGGSMAADRVQIVDEPARRVVVVGEHSPRVVRSVDQDGAGSEQRARRIVVASDEASSEAAGRIRLVSVSESRRLHVIADDDELLLVLSRAGTPAALIGAPDRATPDNLHLLDRSTRRPGASP